MPPRKVMLVRHAEKLADAGESPDLSVAGFARAAAMPTLLLPDGSTTCALSLTAGIVQASFSAERAVASPPRFERPDLIFATRDPNYSSRPRQTRASRLWPSVVHFRLPGGDFQPLLEPDPLAMLAVDDPPGIPKQGADLPVA